MHPGHDRLLFAVKTMHATAAAALPARNDVIF